jgi:glycosyltransferase involved in cell wall biosynthesis
MAFFETIDKKEVPIAPADIRTSVVIPTLNEGGCVGEIIKRVQKLQPEYVNEIIVVDGGSRDNTESAVRSLGIPFLRQPGKGLGDAYRYGAQSMKGNVMIILDADGSHVPEHIPRLLEKIKEGNDLVIASRLKGGLRSEDMKLFSFRTIANFMVSFSCQHIFGAPVSDPWMGFRAIKKDVLLSLGTTSLGQEVDIEMLIRAVKRGYKVCDVETHEPKRMYGESKFNVLFEGTRLSILFVREFLHLSVGSQASKLLKGLYNLQDKVFGLHKE